MRLLVDTNLLLRLAHPNHPHHSAARQCLDRLRHDGHELRVVPQVLYEYWVVLTRPLANNGLGFSATQASTDIQRIKVLFPPLRDERGILEPWERLVVAEQVLGKSAHDARLVAAMKRHGLTHIVTFNTADFRRYPGIAVLDPMQIA